MAETPDRAEIRAGKSFSRLAFYIIVAGWAGFFVYNLLFIEVQPSNTLLDHFLSTESSGIRFRALIFFAPFISSLIGFLVNEREKFLLKTLSSEMELEKLNRALKDYNQKLELEVAERKLIEQKVLASLREKEMLLQEVHHRVKNNMQIISSLLSLQSKHVRDQEDAEMFRDSQNRIRAMAIVHEKIYASRDLAKINLNSYVKTLAGTLYKAYGRDAGKIRLKTDISSTPLSIDSALYCGLIVNELLSNSLKYAFPGGTGEVEITFAPTWERDREFLMTFRDNGVGLPEKEGLAGKGSLGLSLVSTLVTGQMGGTMEVRRETGTEFILKFVLPA